MPWMAPPRMANPNQPRVQISIASPRTFPVVPTRAAPPLLAVSSRVQSVARAVPASKTHTTAEGRRRRLWGDKGFTCRDETTFWASSVENELWNVCTLQIHTSWSALVSCFDDSSEATDTAVVSGCDDSIAARGRTWNLCDTVVHETRWEGNGARMER